MRKRFSAPEIINVLRAARSRSVEAWVQRPLLTEPPALVSQNLVHTQALTLELAALNITWPLRIARLNATY